LSVPRISLPSPVLATTEGIARARKPPGARSNDAFLIVGRGGRRDATVASVLLPEPMLARAGPLPTGNGWRFEPPLDGFRCLVWTHGGRFRAKSRRGWDMTTKLPELALSLRPDVQLDGELIAWNDEGLPDFHRLGRSGGRPAETQSGFQSVTRSGTA